MEHEKISPPQPADGAQQDNRAQTNPTDATITGGAGAPTNDDDLDGSGNSEHEDEDEDEDEGGSEDPSADASNQYWIFVDKQLAKFRARALRLATPDNPAEELLRW